MDYLFDPEDLPEGARYLPETGQVELCLTLNARQKAMFDEVSDQLAATLGREVTPEDVLRHVCESHFARQGRGQMSFN